MSQNPYTPTTKSGVNPPVILGNRLTGQGADSTLQLANKYNQHEHWLSNPADFRFYNLSVGDEVYLYNTAGENIIGDSLPATIDYITGDYLRITTSSLSTVENGTLLLKYNQSVLIQGVSISSGSNIISWFKLPGNTKPGLAGFTTPDISQASLSYAVQGSIVNPTPGLYRLMALLPEPSWLVSAGVQSQGDVNPHCDVQFIINTTGSDLDYGQPITATSRPSEVIFVPKSVNNIGATNYPSFYAKNYLPPNTSVSLRVSQVNPEINRAYASNTLTYTLKFHKVLPN